MLRYTTLFSNYNTYLIFLSVFLSKLHARRQISVFPHIPLFPLILCATQIFWILNDSWVHFFESVLQNITTNSESLFSLGGSYHFKCPYITLFTPSSVWLRLLVLWSQAGGGGGGLSFSNLLDVSHMLQLVSPSLGACDWVSEWASACERLCSCASLSVFRFWEIAALPVCGWRILEERMKIHSCAFSGYPNTTFGVLSGYWQL